MGYSWSDECVRVVGSVDELLQLLKTLFSGGIGIDDYGTRIYTDYVYALFDELLLSISSTSPIKASLYSELRPLNLIFANLWF